MLKFVFLLFLTSSGAHASVTLFDKDDWKFQTSGFIEMDALNDSTRSLTEVAGNAPIDISPSYAGDNGRTMFSIRNSRLAFSATAPVQNNWKSRGYLEFDLLGYDPTPSATAPSNSESSFFSNATMRIRHAYIAAETENWQIFAGQYWTLFGWDPIYVLTTASVPPVSGVLYERTPQITGIHSCNISETAKLQLGFSVSRPSQRDSSVPNLDAGARISFASRRAGFVAPSSDFKAEPMSFAISGTGRQFVVPNAFGSTGDSNRLTGGGLAIDAMIPVIASSNEKEYGNTLSISGEFTSGSGYGDQFPGWTGNLAQTVSTKNSTAPNLDAGQGGVDTSGNFQLVRLQSLNGQLQYHFPQGYETFATAGYGQVASNNISQLVPSTKVVYDRSETYFVNIFHDFTKQLRIAAEYDRFLTHYVTSDYPGENRFQISGWFRF